MGGVCKTWGFFCLAQDGSGDLGLKPSLALGRDNWFLNSVVRNGNHTPQVLHYQDARIQHCHRHRIQHFSHHFQRSLFEHKQEPGWAVNRRIQEDA